MTKRLLALAATAILVIGLVSCGPERQAQKYRELAETSISMSETISGVLERYPAGQYEGNALLEPLLAALPEKWHDDLDGYIGIAGDVRAGATAAALGLADLAENLEERAVEMDAQAEKDAGFWGDLVATGSQLVQAFSGPGGIAGLIGGVIVAVRERRKTAAVVESIEAGRKFDPALNAAFSGQGGAAVNVGLTARGVKARVSKIREKYGKASPDNVPVVSNQKPSETEPAS
jgi:hypothetical protein